MKILWGILGLLAWLAPAYALDVPELKGRVNDYANVFTQSEEHDLIMQLESIEHSYAGKPQVVILTVPTLAGESIEDFANKAFRTWKLGQLSYDNGILFVQATQQREIRIEVGYGLEGDIPDAVAKLVIARDMGPRLAEGKAYEAYKEGLARIKVLLPTEPRAKISGTKDYPWTLIIAAMIVLGVMLAAIWVQVMARAAEQRRLEEYKEAVERQRRIEREAMRAKMAAPPPVQPKTPVKPIRESLRYPAPTRLKTKDEERQTRRADLAEERQRRARKKKEEEEEEDRRRERERQEEEDRRRNDSLWNNTSGDWGSSSSGDTFSGGGGSSGGGGASGKY